MYVPVVNLSVKDNKKQSNFLAKNLKCQCFGMDITQKVRIKIRQISTCFLESNFVGANQFFLLVIQTKITTQKGIKLKEIILKISMTKSLIMI